MPGGVPRPRWCFIVPFVLFVAALPGCDGILGSKEDGLSHVWISHTAFDLDVGDAVRLSAMVTGPLDSRTFDRTRYSPEWSSSDPAVLAVDDSGRVVAKQAGEAQVFARAGGRVDSVSVRVGGAGAPPARVWRSVHAGSEFTCALTDSGERYCWGLNLFGSHGNGIRRLHSGTFSPVSAGDPLRYEALAAGHSFACGRTLQGAGYCWGDNSGRPTDYELLPQRLEIPARLRQIASGGTHACAVDEHGVRHCWGSNRYGQLGVNTATGRQVSPLRITEEVRFATLAAGLVHTCGISVTGQTYCWGSALAGELGEGSPSVLRPLPTRISEDARFERIDAGAFATCALTTEGTPYCWGRNLVGTFLVGDLTHSAVPMPLNTSLRFEQMETGLGHTCGRTAEGEVYCWGRNDLGQLGVAPGETALCATPWEHDPVPCSTVAIGVSDTLRFRQISVGYAHACAVTVDGALYCWGSNRWGELGSGRVVPHSDRPMRVAPEFR
jgi:alpha-tubulin suppressor-like RCC1 family protein